MEQYIGNSKISKHLNSKYTIHCGFYMITRFSHENLTSEKCAANNIM